MHFHITTIIFLIFEHINRVFTQGLPISPCPKIFQYRFDESEWFGMLSVRNTDFGQPLQLRVTLSMRGKPTTDYLGEIELLTRGQYLSDAPVLYKIKFPKSHFPPKLLQITVNNNVLCLGSADHSIFVTQIQLEHTRKYKFLHEDTSQPLSPVYSSDTSSPLSFLPATDALDLGGGHSTSSMSSTDEWSMLPKNVQFDRKHFPLANMEKNPMSHSKASCGTIDDRIRFQALNAQKQSTGSMVSSSPSTSFGNYDSLLLSTPLLQRQSDEILEGSSQASSDAAKAGEKKRNSEDNDDHSPPVVTSDTDSSSESFFDELPAIARGAWPWMAAIYVNNMTSLSYQCGGTLVSSRIVISAAHCFQLLKQRYTANEVLVFLGRHNLRNWNEEGSLAAPVDDIFIHPDFNQHLNSYDADIAVVVLRNQVRFNTFIRPACLWSGSTETQFIEGEHGIVVGWGLGSYNGSKLTSSTIPVPKLMNTPIVSNNVCFQANSNYRSLSSNRTFCAGIISQQQTMKQTKSEFQHEVNRGPCTGDSGAGLMILKNNRWTLRGTVSGLLVIEPSENDAVTQNTTKSSPSCSINQYVIYTDVAQFLDWILAFVI